MAARRESATRAAAGGITGRRRTRACSPAAASPAAASSAAPTSTAAVSPSGPSRPKTSWQPPITCSASTPTRSCATAPDARCRWCRARRWFTICWRKLRRLRPRRAPLNLGVSFPAVGEVIAKEAADFRGLPSNERVRAILDLIASGEALLQHSPKRDVGLRLKEKDELAWQAALAAFFRQHGC